ncbi:MAG: TatD family hydrolase [Bdellovibrionales bacterium]|nr:TatD family hydrolase [Bdellovibrionales bacterium]
MKPIWDSHCHLSDLRIFEKRDQILKALQKEGLGGFFLGGYDPEDWSRQIVLKREFTALGAEVKTSFGLHPWWVSQASSEKIEEAFDLLEVQIGLADALGETGLDFQPRFSDAMKELQTQVFERSLFIRHKSAQAYQRDFPLVLHVVRAHPEVLAILSSAKLGSVPGLVHSYSGDWRSAQKYLDLGFLISISGAFLRSGGERLRETIQKVPLDQLAVESDSPDQMPTGFQSKLSPGLNDPSSLLKLARAIADVRSESSEKILEASTNNVIKLFARG